MRDPELLVPELRLQIAVAGAEIAALTRQLDVAHATIAERDLQLADAHARIADLSAQLDAARGKLLSLDEENQRLLLGLMGRKSERFVPDDDEQMSFQFLTNRDSPPCSAEPAEGTSVSVPEAAPVESSPAPAPTTPPQSAPSLRPLAPVQKRKPVRKPLPANLPRRIVEIIPACVRSNPDAYVRIGEARREILERVPSMLVAVEIVRGKFKLKDNDAPATTVLIEPPPELPIPGSNAGPGMLADVAVRRFADHLPFHRLQEIYARDGLRLARSTMCGWMIALANLLASLIEAMFHDARQQPLLCVDASGVRIQANKQCARGHFWVMLAPERHALFRFSEEHTSDAVRELIGEDYRGKVLADAHTVYDFLFEQRCIECGCWAHARRYFHKALKSDPERAGHAMGTIRWLFAAEHAATTMEERLHIRDSASRPTVDAFFHWVQEQRNDPAVLDGSPISQALNYAHNQSTALRRYLDDARVPMHNNDAERALRHMAVGRNNWLFLGSPSGGVTAATFYTLIMSCKMHGLDPWSYLRDLFCLLPTWPSRRVIELAPVNWESTLARPEVQEELAANVYRAISIAENALPARQAEAA